jgi:hypothetical protein
MRLHLLAAVLGASCASAFGADPGPPLGPVAKGARLVLDEDWSGGTIAPDRWYIPRKKWGNGNHGVVPENVRIARDAVAGRERNVLVCEAHGDKYDGPVVGHEGEKARVGGMIVSREFFASGRFEVVMKIGSARPHPGGPADPRRPKGAVPAVWTYGYRYVKVPDERMHEFVPETPLYNPHMPRYGGGANEYWSELDFPEFGKGGDFDKAMYNTFLQNKHQSRTFNVAAAVDGQYHTFTTEWRTELTPLEGLTDRQVVESEGYWWVRDKAVPFNTYWGNPVKRLGPDRYAVYGGARADHWIDGKPVGTNPTFVPSMAAQLTIGVWLPEWGGPAPWETATVSIASVKVWQDHDEGDVRGILTEDVPDNFAPDGKPLK